MPEPGAGAGDPVVLNKEQSEALQKEKQPAVLTSSSETGTISDRKGIRISMQFFAHRNSKDYKTIVLPKQEYSHVMSEIASHLIDDDKISPVFVKRIGNYIYTIENNGFAITE